MEKELKDEIKRQAEELLRQGQQTVAQGAATQLFEERAKLVQKAVQVASDTIDLAEKLAADGHPQKKQIAELVTKSVVGAMSQLASERQPSREVTVPLEEDPSSASSSKSETGSPESMKSLPDKKAGKRPQGRPLGSKNKPKG